MAGAKKVEYLIIQSHPEDFWDVFVYAKGQCIDRGGYSSFELAKLYATHVINRKCKRQKK